MTARSLRRINRRFGVQLVPLPEGVEALRLQGGTVLVRHVPGDTRTRAVR